MSYSYSKKYYSRNAILTD